MPDYRHMRSGSLNTPNGGTHSPGPAPRFDGPRSPPNTSHVPCKFFRQGACQAGSACPFSHDLGGAADTVCKYFAKGNCKFGPKCANIHVLPDGRRINYGKNGVTIGPAPINLAGRSPQSSTSPPSAAVTATNNINNTTSSTANGLDGARQLPPPQPATSALTKSLYGANSYAAAAFPYDDRHNKHNLLGRQPSLENGLPIIDVPYSNSYGSPRDDPDRFGLALSPVNGLSVLDAPLPASFDSNGISNAARFPAAPWPSSVPSKFGFESSSPSSKDARTSDTLKLLHTSAFGSEHLTPAASSPPNYSNGVDEYFGRRAMHSSRFSRPSLLSNSVPKTSSVDRDWTPDFAFDEDSDNLPENYVPENLQDLLTPAEKARRGSIRADDNASMDGLSRYGGSPIGTSPSRWAPVFASKDDELSRSARGAASAFGHVGSPLRNSVLAQERAEDGGSPRPVNARAPGSDSMSMLSQQLRSSSILDDGGPDNSPSRLHPGSARSPPSASSGSIGSPVTGRITTPINEEVAAEQSESGPFVFSMEEVNGEAAKAARKRLSSSLGMGEWSNPKASSPGINIQKTTNGTNGTHGHGSSKKTDDVSVNGQ